MIGEIISFALHLVGYSLLGIMALGWWTQLTERAQPTRRNIGRQAAHFNKQRRVAAQRARAIPQVRPTMPVAPVASVASVPVDPLRGDLILALRGLGYPARKATLAVDGVTGTTFDERFKGALALVSKSNA